MQINKKEAMCVGRPLMTSFGQTTIVHYDKQDRFLQLQKPLFPEGTLKELINVHDIYM
jgi:hypothetical protein